MDGLGPQELAEDMARVARVLQGEATAQLALQRMADLAVLYIAGCDHAAVSVYNGANVTTPAASDDMSLKVDRIQYETGQGPCLDAIRQHEMFVTADLRTEERWQRFAARAAAETGIRSMLSFRLFLQGDTLGALNLYSRQPGAFTDESLAVGLLFATHAAVALSAAREHEEVEELTGDLLASEERAGRYEEQAGIAAALQRSLLTELPDLAPLLAAARYQPAVTAAEVGGDWYDALRLPDGAVLIVVGDIGGHDVHAAVAMAQARSLLRGLAMDRCEPPHQLLTRLDTVLAALGVDRIATCLIARLEEDDGGWRATLASAGHPPPLLLAPDRAELLDVPADLLLGAGGQADRRSLGTVVAPGSTLLLYTDGLIESRGRSFDVGLAELRGTASRIVDRRAGRLSLDALHDELIDRLAPHPIDDVCLVSVQVPT